MNNIDNSNAIDNAVLIATIMAIDHLNRACMRLFLDTIINNKKAFFTSMNELLCTEPYRIRAEALILKKIIHTVMRDAIKVISKIRACIIIRCTYKKLNILFFCNHRHAFFIQ